MPRRFAVFSILAPMAFAGCAAERTEEVGAGGASSAPTPATSLVGQLLLPAGGDRRGLEVHAWIADQDGEERQLWIFPDADGRFARDVSGQPTRVVVHAGSEVYRVEGDDLPRANGRGRVDLGVVDLRERLVVRRVRVLAAAGAPGGLVRLGLWVGPPHRGPQGELPSLGSKQFPAVELGSEVEWLLPPDARAVHFLVERPEGPGRGVDWRSGAQQVFGPYESASFPLDLELD